MDGPGKDLFPISGLANVHEFYIHQLRDKLFTCLGFFWCTCYLRSTAPGRLIHIWTCQEGACEVPRDIGLDFGTAEQRLRASSWARLHFLTACGVKQSKAKQPLGVCSGMRNSKDYASMDKSFLNWGDGAVEGTALQVWIQLVNMESKVGQQQQGWACVTRLGVSDHDRGRSAQENGSWVCRSLQCGHIANVGPKRRAGVLDIEITIIIRACATQVLLPSCF